MVVTLKLISTAVCYQDGLARPEVRTSLSSVNCVRLSALCSLLPDYSAVCLSSAKQCRVGLSHLVPDDMHERHGCLQCTARCRSTARWTSGYRS